MVLDRGSRRPPTRGTSTCSGSIPRNKATGVGSALVRFGLERAARDGADAFLETAIEANVAYYERFGFRTVFEGRASDDAPRIWFMRTGG